MGACFAEKQPFRGKGGKHTLDIPSSLISLFHSRFINTPSIWSFQMLSWSERKQKHVLTYCRKKPDHEGYKPLGLEHIRRHIQPAQVSDTISIAALDEVYCSKWACWDFDAAEPGGEELVTALRDMGLNPIREAARQDRFGHVWLFFSDPVPALSLAAFSRALIDYLGLNPGIEFFPKQSSKERDKLGLSSVRLPLGIHNKPGADLARGLFHDVEPDIISQLEYITRQPYDDPKALKTLSQAQLLKEKKQDDLRAREEALRAATRKEQWQKTDRELVDLLKIIPASELRSISADWYSTRCPSCAAIGHDQTGNNLNICKADGTRFKCWRANGCTALEILRACG